MSINHGIAFDNMMRIIEERPHSEALVDDVVILQTGLEFTEAAEPVEGV